MSIHRYTSRGRTRQPKNLAMNHSTGSNLQPNPQVLFKALGGVDLVASAGNLDNLLTSSATAGAAGYKTENQKYLHLALSQSSAGSFTTSTVTLYGYNRQFGVWGKMKYPVAFPTSSANPDFTFMNHYADLTLTSEAATTFYITIPLNGTDRVGFVGANNAGLTVFAAGSCE